MINHRIATMGRSYNTMSPVKYRALPPQERAMLAIPRDKSAAGR
jgi:hypothetical protein